MTMQERTQAKDAKRPGKKASGQKPSYPVPAAEKALDVLEFMADRQDGVTQTEISAGVGRSLHEIYRIIQLLERRGYLFRTADRYRLSLRLFELAHKHPPVNRLVDESLPVMRALAQNCDQSCHLAVLDGERILIILQVDSPLPMRYSVALGSQFPVLETSSGAVLLAYLPEGEREQLTARLVSSGDDSKKNVDKRLGGIVSKGFEMRPSLAVEGCTNISFPVYGHMGLCVAALTVPYLPQKQARSDHRMVFEQTQTAALAISRALGAPEESLAGFAGKR